jgi:hypothetical protein
MYPVNILEFWILIVKLFKLTNVYKSTVHQRLKAKGEKEDKIVRIACINMSSVEHKHEIETSNFEIL